jgi:hypothetical protein
LKRLSSRTGVFLKAPRRETEKFWDRGFRVNSLELSRQRPPEGPRQPLTQGSERRNKRRQPICPKFLAFLASVGDVISFAGWRVEGGMATKRPERSEMLKIEPLWDRIQSQIEWYNSKAKANQQAYKASKIAIILLAIAIPILAEYGALPGLHDTRALLVSIAAGAILLLEGLQQLNKWHENWILYRSTCEALRNERHLFVEKAGAYADLRPEAAQKVLAERVGDLLMSEHSRWANARREKIETTTG